MKRVSFCFFHWCFPYRRIAKAIEVKVLQIYPTGTANPRQTLDLAIPKATEKNGLPSFGYMAEGGKTGISEAVIGLIACEPSYKPEDIGAGRIPLEWEAKWPAQIHDYKAAPLASGNARNMGSILQELRFGVPRQEDIWFRWVRVAG